MRRTPRQLGVVPKVALEVEVDRKSTRLNSSHSQISYAVFCLKKKTQDNKIVSSGRPPPALSSTRPQLWIPSNIRTSGLMSVCMTRDTQGSTSRGRGISTVQNT